MIIQEDLVSLDIACQVFNIDKTDLLSESKLNKYAYPRFILYSYLRKKSYNLKDVAKLINRINHSTVISGLKQHKKLLRKNQNYKAMNELFLNSINK